jgi:hypothetical protein
MRRAFAMEAMMLRQIKSKSSNEKMRGKIEMCINAMVSFKLLYVSGRDRADGSIQTQRCRW